MSFKSSMIEIVGESIETGPVPFNIYTHDRHGVPMLFCKAGYEITQARLETLRSSDRTFYVQREEMSEYVDYAGDRIDKIVSDERISIIEKLDLVKNVGSRMVGRMVVEPEAVLSDARAQMFIGGYIEFIIGMPQVRSNLFTVAGGGQYLLSRSFNVCTLCLLIGEAIYGPKRTRLTHLGIGGMLLDIGMTRIDPQLVEKRGELDEEELVQVRRHVQAGRDILAKAGMDDDVIAMVSQHHERADGSGYPLGMYGDEMHEYGRIAAVVDTYDAITSERPYKPPMSQMEALAELAREKDKFDPLVMEMLLNIVLTDERLIRHFKEKYL